MNNEKMNLQDLRKLAVAENQELLLEERETHIIITADNIGWFQIAGDIKIFNQWLLKCPDFVLRDYHLNRIGNAAVYIDGYLPISYLRFKTKNTESMNYPSRIISM